MKKINGLLLAGICAGSLYGCGGSDDKGADPANSAPPGKSFEVEHVTVPNAVLYQANYMSADGKAGPSGYALQYEKRDGGTYPRWSAWANNGVVASWWWLNDGDETTTSKPATARLHRTSYLEKDGGIAAAQAIRQADVVYERTVHAQPQIVTEHPVVGVASNIELNLAATGTDSYPTWSGKVALTELKTRGVNTGSWHANNGYGTELLGNVESTRNGDKVTITMELLAAGCTLTGEGISSGHTRFDRLQFTGFERCRFDPAKGEDWTAVDYHHNAALAKAKESALGYVATFKSDHGSRLLVVGFPELDGLVWLVNPR